MQSWWQLGEGIGQQGNELEIFLITCAFCGEKGNFAFDHRAEKKKANSTKTLHFDTLKCGNCGGYVMVLWSASEWGGLYAHRVLPWPIRLDKYPPHWPEPVGRLWIQAHRSANDENWDAAALMARSALQAALRHAGAQSGTLKQEIDGLAAQSVLPPHMREWAHELRALANESAHPDVAASKPVPEDVRDVIQFLDFLLQYLFDLPHEIEQYRSRKFEAPKGK